MLSDSGSGASANRSWLIDAGRNGSGPREAYFKVNNILAARARQQGLVSRRCRIIWSRKITARCNCSGVDSIRVDTYFVYPEELKTVARVQQFRDFVVSKAQHWPS
jgi:hypothetical protein